ncbi:protein draper-like [Clytia hemisphaerica]
MRLKVLFILLLAVCLVESWRRRRRRRRRSCSPVNCVRQWNAWTPCTCLGDSSRTSRVTRGASCGGSCANWPQQKRKCRTNENWRCMFPYGYCNPHSTSKCTCLPGRMGKTCGQKCPHNKFGSGCKQTCNCGGAQCDPQTGKCRCNPGRFGKHCHHAYAILPGIQYIRLKGTTPCHAQIKVAFTAQKARNVCPKPSHYAYRCQCGFGSSAYNLFYGQTCQCAQRVPNSGRYRSSWRNRYVTISYCCPR